MKSREEIAKMLRAAWLQREPLPSAWTWDDLGPIMRTAWLDTADAVLSLLAEERAECLHAAKHSPACKGCKRVMANAIRARGAK